MSIGIFGTKLGMTQVFGEEGNAIPVTVVKTEPNQVVNLRTKEKNGYSSVLLGVGQKKKTRINKPLQGQYELVNKESGKDVAVKQKLKEFRVDDVSAYELGGFVNIDIFEAGELIDVIGTSKGKGFQGAMKRHGFAGGPGGHGSQFHRAPGAVGQCAWPSKIFKGKKMPGKMGNDRVTVKNLKVVAVDVENNRILVKGAVPGPKNGTLFLMKKK